VDARYDDAPEEDEAGDVHESAEGGSVDSHDGKLANSDQGGNAF